MIQIEYVVITYNLQFTNVVNAVKVVTQLICFEMFSWITGSSFANATRKKTD